MLNEPQAEETRKKLYQGPSSNCIKSVIKKKKYLKQRGLFYRHIIYRETRMRMTGVFSCKTMQGRPYSTDRKNSQPRILYPAKVPFKTENEINTFSDI